MSYQSDLNRMRELINYGSPAKKSNISESKGSIEYTQQLNNGGYLAIIREGRDYFIKQCAPTLNIVAENFGYINGEARRDENRYSDYNTAFKHLELMCKCINEETVSKKQNSSVITESKAEKKEDSNLSASGEEMKKSIERIRQISENMAKIGRKHDSSTSGWEILRESSMIVNDAPDAKTVAVEDQVDSTGDEIKEQPHGISNSAKDGDTYDEKAKKINEEDETEDNLIIDDENSEGDDTTPQETFEEEGNDNKLSDAIDSLKDAIENLESIQGEGSETEDEESDIDDETDEDEYDDIDDDTDEDEYEIEIDEENITKQYQNNDDDDYFTNKYPNKEKIRNGSGKKVKKFKEKNCSMNEANEFGNHPGYQKKVFKNFPVEEKPVGGNRYIDDESAKSEKPFGTHIGRQKPFVEIVTDTVIEEMKRIGIEKFLKKK